MLTMRKMLLLSVLLPLSTLAMPIDPLVAVSFDDEDFSPALLATLGEADLDVSGTFIYSTSAPDSDPTPGLAVFDPAGVFLGIVNEVPLFTPGIIIKGGLQFETPEFRVAFNQSYDLTRLELITSGWNLLSGAGGREQLPSTLDVNDLSAATVVLDFRSKLTNSLLRVTSTLPTTKVSVRTVPEPPTLVLLAAGLLIAWRGRGSR